MVRFDFCNIFPGAIFYCVTILCAEFSGLCRASITDSNGHPIFFYRGGQRLDIGTGITADTGNHYHHVVDLFLHRGIELPYSDRHFGSFTQRLIPYRLQP